MKQILIRLICSLLMFSFFYGLTAGNTDAIQEIFSKYNQTNSFQIVLEQENYYPAQNKTLKSFGRMYKDGEYFLIIFDKPHHQFIKFTHSQITVYDSSVKTAYLFPFNKFPSFNPSLLFNEMEKANFTLKNNKNPFNIYLPALSNYFDFLTLNFDFNRQFIRNISYKDAMGNQVILKFKKHTFNKKPGINLSSYTYPPDTKVFKQ